MAEMIIMSFYDQRAINIHPITINEYSAHYQPPLISITIWLFNIAMENHIF